MKKYIIILASVLSLYSCSKSDNGAVIDSDIISFNAHHPNVKSRATSTGFENGDKVGIFAVEYSGGTALPLQVGGNFLNNEPLSYNNGTWSSSRKLYWSDNKLDFYAYYPYTKVSSVDKLIFDLKTDQRTEKTANELGGYEGSDFLHAKVEGATREGGIVQFKFKHVMTKISVKILKGANFIGNLPTDISVNIYNTITTAYVDLVKGSASKYPYGSKKTINAKRVADDKFEAVVVPQYIDLLTPLVEITMGGIAYLLDYSISLRPGYEHTITVVVNTSPDQEKTEISIDGTINDWK